MFILLYTNKKAHKQFRVTYVTYLTLGTSYNAYVQIQLEEISRFNKNSNNKKVYSNLPSAMASTATIAKNTKFKHF